METVLMDNLQDLKKNLEMKPIRPQNVIRNWEDINVICNRLINKLEIRYSKGY